MKTLIIPDVHNKIIQAEKIISQHPEAEKIVFLGDYFDSFGDSLELTEATAKWLSSKLKDDRYVMLFGNHDIAYAFPSKYTMCSGYTDDKRDVISRVIKHGDWDDIHFYHFVGDLLCTHAGLHDYYATKADGENIQQFLNRSSKQANMLIRQSKEHWFYSIGKIRYGYSKYGGILWCDAREFQPVKGVRQLFGHTVQYTSIPLTFDSGDICLDTCLNHYAINDGETLIIHKNPEFKYLPTPYDSEINS